MNFLVKHNVVGPWIKGQTISDTDLRERPGFANDKDKNDETFTGHLNRLINTGAIERVKEKGEGEQDDEAAPAASSGNDGLDDLNKEQLLRAATEEGVEDADSSMKKADLIAAIRAKRAGLKDEGDGE